MDSIDEKQTITNILAGQTEEYRLLVDRYHRGLINHLASLTHDPMQAEDLAQEAFIQAFNKLHQYKSEYAFSTWLYQIANNLAYRYIKQSQRYTKIDGVDELPDESKTKAEKMDTEQARKTVQEAVKTLDPRYQQVISLYYWENFSYEDIARVVGVPIGTVRTWLFRAKDQLRKELYGQT